MVQNHRYQVVGSYGRGADGGVCVFEPSGLRIDENYSSDVLFKLTERDTDDAETFPQIKLWCPAETLQLASSLSPPKTVIYLQHRRLQPKQNPTAFLMNQTTYTAAVLLDVILQVCSDRIVFVRNDPSFQHIQTITLVDLFQELGLTRSENAKLVRAQVAAESSLLLLQFSSGLAVVVKILIGEACKLQYELIHHENQARCSTLFHKQGPKLAFIHAGREMKLCIVDLSTHQRYLAGSHLDKGDYAFTLREAGEEMEVDGKGAADIGVEAFDSRR